MRGFLTRVIEGSPQIARKARHWWLPSRLALVPPCCICGVCKENEESVVKVLYLISKRAFCLYVQITQMFLDDKRTHLPHLGTSTSPTDIT
jgi:hypothetical protein